MVKPVRKRKVPVRYESAGNQELGEVLQNDIGPSPKQIRTNENRRMSDQRIGEEGTPRSLEIIRNEEIREDREKDIVEINPRKLLRKPRNGQILLKLTRVIGVLTQKVNELGNAIELHKKPNSSGEREIEVNTGVAESSDYRTVQDTLINETELDEQEGMSKSEYRNVIYNVRNINIEKPKFGDKTEIHPVTFIEDLEVYLKRTAKEGKELDLIRDCLVGNARDWARVYKGRWKGVEDFKIDFLATFWGEKDQNELRRTIVQGSWNRTQTPSMLNYFLQLIGRAQMLNFKFPEKQLIADIIRHYPRYIQQNWITSKIESIIETAEFLRNMDDINRQEPNHYIPEVQNKAKERRGLEQYQQGYRNWQKPNINNNKKANDKVQTSVIEISTDEVRDNVTLN